MREGREPTCEREWVTDVCERVRNRRMDNRRVTEGKDPTI